MPNFSYVFSSWGIMFDWFMGFNKLEAVLGCLITSGIFVVTLVANKTNYFFFALFSGQ